MLNCESISSNKGFGFTTGRTAFVQQQEKCFKVKMTSWGGSPESDNDDTSEGCFLSKGRSELRGYSLWLWELSHLPEVAELTDRPVNILSQARVLPSRAQLLKAKSTGDYSSQQGQVFTMQMLWGVCHYFCISNINISSFDLKLKASNMVTTSQAHGYLN